MTILLYLLELNMWTVYISICLLAVCCTYLRHACNVPVFGLYCCTYLRYACSVSVFWLYSSLVSSNLSTFDRFSNSSLVLTKSIHKTWDSRQQLWQSKQKGITLHLGVLKNQFSEERKTLCEKNDTGIWTITFVIISILQEFEYEPLPLWFVKKW